ncbi:hypothetical protein F4782DRAFT_531915 [Xylaria castorea]|nr:hypothetical protein F4782DRAFT_531915 [Xylaria castorea]
MTDYSEAVETKVAAIRRPFVRAPPIQEEVAGTKGDDLAATIEEQQDGGSSPLDSYDCRMNGEPEDDDQETQETNVGLAIFHHPSNQDNADETKVSTSLATSYQDAQGSGTTLCRAIGRTALSNSAALV